MITIKNMFKVIGKKMMLFLSFFFNDHFRNTTEGRDITCRSSFYKLSENLTVSHLFPLSIPIQIKPLVQFSIGVTP
ncbi:Uncharacterised protein [Enterobacter hormaechei]|nr:Uncharacterised protein [Enterobacter hormaechei]CZY07386.1 Uncharacterised protein [Enterobacter hormaechei]